MAFGRPPRDFFSHRCDALAPDRVSITPNDAALDGEVTVDRH